MMKRRFYDLVLSSDRRDYRLERAKRPRMMICAGFVVEALGLWGMNKRHFPARIRLTLSRVPLRKGKHVYWNEYAGWGWTKRDTYNGVYTVMGEELEKLIPERSGVRPVYFKIDVQQKPARKRA